MRSAVLFVDDNRPLLDALRRSLHAQPFDIHLATGATEALAVMRAIPIAVIVADQDMPGMTGSALLAKVRFEYPDTMLFMLTGRATLELAISAINLGEVHRFFTKPCHPGELAAGIRDAIRQRQLFSLARRLLMKVKGEESLLPKGEGQRPVAAEREVEEYPPHDMDGLLDALDAYLGDAVPAAITVPPGVEPMRVGRVADDRGVA